MRCSCSGSGEQVEAVDADHAADAGRMQQRGRHPLDGCVGPLQGGCVGQLQRDEEIALVFLGKEAGGQPAPHEDRDDRDGGQREHGDDRFVNQAAGSA